MVILNFTVPFALDAIPKGLKTRTMRPVRTNPNSVWNRLFVKWNQTSISVQDYLDKIEHPSLHHKEIQLQLWWQQRSRFFRCEHCGTKILFNQEHKQLWEQRKKEDCWNKILTINEFKCKQCQGIMWMKEAHELGKGILTNMTKRTLGSLSAEEWHLDGFKSLYHSDGQLMKSVVDVGFEWFMKTYKMTRESAELLSVYIIEWRLI